MRVRDARSDARSDTHAQRGLQPRVHFGDHWVEESVVEIFKEDIARFRVILTRDTEHDPIGMVKRGEIPNCAHCACTTALCIAGIVPAMASPPTASRTCA